MLSSEAGDNTLVSGRNNDRLLGEEDDDRFVMASDGSKDLVDGNAGSDTLDLSHSTAGWRSENAGSQKLVARTSSRLEYANIEHFIGSGQNDEFRFYSLLSLSLDGGGGDDFVIVSELVDQTTIDGGAGCDRLLVLSGLDLDIDLAAETLPSVNGAEAAFRRFESLFISRANATVQGSNANEEIETGLGDDLVNGLGGADTMAGGRGRDMLSGGNGNDLIEASSYGFVDGESCDGRAGTEEDGRTGWWGYRQRHLLH